MLFSYFPFKISKDFKKKIKMTFHDVNSTRKPVTVTVDTQKKGRNL